MFIIDGKLLLLLLSFVFIHLIHTTTLAQPDFVSYYCENADNYTVNSAYQRNLNTTLSKLPTTNNGFGFYNLTIGQGNINTVCSIALCRGDVMLVILVLSTNFGDIGLTRRPSESY
ncbi:putative Gnk2-like domain-containing protein [Helianthus annuus]|nr:putative Gnk2-like domain-containing protein [Helianthus annuus]